MECTRREKKIEMQGMDNKLVCHAKETGFKKASIVWHESPDCFPLSLHLLSASL